MAGIYIHIPFCKTHCSYCDFYSVTNNKNISGIVKSICEELVLKNNYTENEPIETIYFGGGTPSYIATEFSEKILQKIPVYLVLNPDAGLLGAGFAGAVMK